MAWRQLSAKPFLKPMLQLLIDHNTQVTHFQWIFFLIENFVDLIKLSAEGNELPHKHAIICQYRACTGPMLATSDQYKPGNGNYWHVYRVCKEREKTLGPMCESDPASITDSKLLRLTLDQYPAGMISIGWISI